MTRKLDPETAHAEVVSLAGRMTAEVAKLHGLVVNDCLATETIKLDASGQATRDFRVPFGSVAVHNGGAAVATIANAEAADAAVSGGVGVVPIPSGVAAVVNMSGRSWTIYGTAGARVVVSTFTKPQPPAWANLGTL